MYNFNHILIFFFVFSSCGNLPILINLILAENGINKLINITPENDESEKWKQWNENQIKKNMRLSKLEELAIAYKNNKVEI